jgi:hypothetical protein
MIGAAAIGSVSMIDVRKRIDESLKTNWLLLILT